MVHSAISWGYSRHHLERGAFPNYTKVDPKLATPFGLKRDEDFKNRTNEDNRKANYSEWQKWVDREHGPALRARICELNDIHFDHLSSQVIFDARLDQYMRMLIDFRAERISVAPLRQTRRSQGS